MAENKPTTKKPRIVCCDGDIHGYKIKLQNPWSNIENTLGPSDFQTALKTEILPVSDLDVALHNFVNKDDKMAFHSCIQYNLEETRNKIALALDSDVKKFEEEDIIVKFGECLEERVKERTLKPKDAREFAFSGQSLENVRNRRSTGGLGSAASFSDDEDATPFLGSTKKGKASQSMRSMGIRHSQRSASAAASGSVRSLGDDEDEVDSDSNDETAKLDVNDIAESSDDADTTGRGSKGTE